MTYLMQLPGFGVMTAITILSAIGDIQSSGSAKHLTSDSGLTGGLDQSGTHLVQKGITKEGCKELRWALVEAAQRAVKSDARWKRKFQEMEKCMHRNQAIVAEARQLLELGWYILTRHQPYRHFSHERIACKYLTRAWQMDEPARDGLTRQQFARYYLMKVGIGHDLTRMARDPRKISSEAERLTLRPALKLTE